MVSLRIKATDGRTRIEMESRFRLLSSRSRTGAARQLTLEAAVAWSYELLHDTEKLVFASVSVFPSSFDLSAAESECSKAMDIDEFEVDDLVESLVDKSLLQAEQRPGALRYRMLETIAQYAADRLADLGTEVAERVTATHALHFLALAEEAAPHLEASDHAEWMTKLEADYDNVRMALSSLTASTEHGAEALRMVGFLRIFWRETGGATWENLTISQWRPSLIPVGNQPPGSARMRSSLGLPSSTTSVSQLQLKPPLKRASPLPRRSMTRLSPLGISVSSLWHAVERESTASPRRQLKKRS